MANFTGGMAICPFYNRETGLSIYCSLYPDSFESHDDIFASCSISCKFSSSDEKVKYQRRYCLRYYYPYCPLAGLFLSRVNNP